MSNKRLRCVSAIVTIGRVSTPTEIMKIKKKKKKERRGNKNKQKKRKTKIRWRKRSFRKFITTKGVYLNPLPHPFAIRDLTILLVKIINMFRCTPSPQFFEYTFKIRSPCVLVCVRAYKVHAFLSISTRISVSSSTIEVIFKFSRFRATHRSHMRVSVRSDVSRNLEI